MKKLLFLALVLTCTVGHAQESITLTAPIPSVNAYVPKSVFIQVQPSPVILITIVHVASGREERFAYPCQTPPALPDGTPGQGCAMDTEAKVLTMITALNSANLTTRSLWRRIFDRLLLDFPTRFVGATVQ